MISLSIFFPCCLLSWPHSSDRKLHQKQTPGTLMKSSQHRWSRSLLQTSVSIISLWQIFQFCMVTLADPSVFGFLVPIFQLTCAVLFFRYQSGMWGPQPASTFSPVLLFCEYKRMIPSLPHTHKHEAWTPWSYPLNVSNDHNLCL